MKRTVWILWCCFVIRGGFYACSLPVWEGWDEYSHFAFLQTLALDGRLPDPATATPREVMQSLQIAPVPLALTKHVGNLPVLTHDEFWRLTPEARELRTKALQELRPQRPLEIRPNPTLRLYESQQAPLYYLLLAPIYSLFREAALAERIVILRLASVLLASLVVPLTFGIGERVFQGRTLGLGAVFVLVSMPGLILTVSRVSNDALAVPVGAALILATLSGIWWAIGIALGVALLTKAYFLCAIPVLLIVTVRSTGSRVQCLTRAAMILGLAAAVAGWWYLRAWHVTGSFTGSQTDIAAQDATLWQRLIVFGEVDWLRAIDYTFQTHIWSGGWSFLQVRSWMYRFFAVFGAAALVGAAILFVRRKSAHVTPEAFRWVGLYLVFMLAAMVYHATTTYLNEHISATCGWYLYAVAAAECVVIPAGFMLFLNARLQPYVYPALCASFAALEIFAMHFYLLPYVGGLTFRTAGGLPAALKIVDLAPGVLFSRLAANKPEWLSASVLLGWWCVFLLATLYLVVLSFRWAASKSVLK